MAASTGTDRRRRGWVRRHRALSVLLVLVLVLLGLVAGGAAYVHGRLEAIPRIPIQHYAGQPAAPSDGSENILLLGADNGDNGGSVAQEVASGHWRPGSHRSDTLIVMHVTADRKHVYLVSIPRDTYVTVAGHGKQKINAAFSYGGPSLAVRTVEQFTGVRMQHTAIIDWNGFRDVADALGGVRVYVSQTTADARGVGGEWKKGWTTLRGNRALRYVRTRYGLRNGDFDRIQRQQNFLRAALAQTRADGTLANPVRLNALLGATTRNLTLDDQMTNGDIEHLARTVAGLGGGGTTYLTTPLARFADTAVGSVVVPDRARTAELFSDLAHDRLDRYVTKYAGDAGVLAPSDQVR